MRGVLRLVVALGVLLCVVQASFPDMPDKPWKQPSSKERERPRKTKSPSCPYAAATSAKPDFTIRWKSELPSMQQEEEEWMRLKQKQARSSTWEQQGRKDRNSYMKDMSWNQDDDAMEQQQQQPISSCRQYSHDPQKLAKCERKSRPQKQSKDFSQGTSETSPQCQHYVNDPYKLEKCERKASQDNQHNQYEGENLASTFPHCQRYVYDSHKLVKCENKARKSKFGQSFYDESSANLAVSPLCQRYIIDPYKLEICERKALEMNSRAQAEEEAFTNQKQQASNCQSCAQDTKMNVDPNHATINGEPRVQGSTLAYCQRYSYDPYKMAKCERKTDYWNAMYGQQQTTDADSDESGEEQPHPQCQRFAYNPHKLAKCEYKLNKYNARNNVYKQCGNSCV